MKQTTRWCMAAVLAIGWAASASAGNKKPVAVSSITETERKADFLAVGRYTAKLKPFVCGGCAEWVQERLVGIPGLSNVKVDPATARLEFTLDKAVSRKLIQKTLDGAAREMGMGADYTLGDLKPKTK